MIGGLDRPGCSGLVEGLVGLRGLLLGADGPTKDRPARIRSVLEPLLAVEAREGAPAVAEALRRLVLMAEVWECLAADGPEVADALPGFFAEAIDHLSGDVGRGDPRPASAWIIEESSARWGDYLALVDPSSTPEPGPVAPIDVSDESSWADDDVPAIDPIELLRRLSGVSVAAVPDIPADPPIVGLFGTSEEPTGAVFGQVSGAAIVVDGPSERDEPTDPDLLGEARSLELDAELREVFLADMSDLLGRIQGLVLGLGGDDDGGMLHELCRCFHTLKGAAGSVGLEGLAATIHALEDDLDAAGRVAEAGLVRRLEDTLSLLDGILGALTGAEAAPGTSPEDSTPSTAAIASSEGAEENPHVGMPDALIRVTESRFDELMDVASELLTRRRAWAEQAGRMKQLAIAARACSHRLRGSVERLGDAMPRRPSDGRPAPAAGGELDGLLRRMTEQAEDLAALAATARESSIPMAAEAEDLSRLSLRLWDGLQSIRIVPVRGLFQRLVRVARDAARVEGRMVDVQLIGEETGADRVVVDKVYEPLLHLMRNAVGHGVESPEERARSGKPSSGQITLEARRAGNTLVLAVRDDGRGLDYDAIAAKGRRLGLLGPDERPDTERLNALIFAPGFSTRGQANAISGRGVGMDVVAREVELLRGRVELTSQSGRGTRFEIHLPARLSLEHMMVVRVCGLPFAVPTAALEAIHRATSVEEDGRGATRAAVVEGRRLPMVDLGAVLGFSSTGRESCPMVLVLRADAEPIGLRVDGVDGPRELVVKPLGPLLAGHPAISGAGLTTGGEVIPAIDAVGLSRLTRAGTFPIAPPEPPPAGPRPAALVVDDSLSVRRVATRILRALGFEVDEAADGEEALGRLRDRDYQLVLTDLEMPRMDGFALLAELGRTKALEATRVVVTSTLADAATRRRVLDLGAVAFVPKPVDSEELAAAVAPLLRGRGCRDEAESAAGSGSPQLVDRGRRWKAR